VADVGNLLVVEIVQAGPSCTVLSAWEKGACRSVEALKVFTTGMDLKERSELLDPLITRALDDGASSVYLAVLRLLVLMALGIRGDSYDGCSSQSMMSVAINMNYGLAVHAIIHLQPQVLEEVDTEGRTPLVYAAVHYQQAIYLLLLEKGASLDGLKAFTNSMDIHERSKILDPLLRVAMQMDNRDGSRSATALMLLVQIALGTNYGADDDRSSSQYMMNVAIDMSYGLAIRTIIHLEPRALVEVDAEGRTPFAYAFSLGKTKICEVLLEKYTPPDQEAGGLAAMVLGRRLVDDAHAAIVDDCPRFLDFLLAKDTSIWEQYVGAYGRTLFAAAFSLRRPKTCELLLGDTRKTNTATEDLNLESDLAGHFRFAIGNNCPRVLNSLLATGVDVEKVDIEGQTPLALAAEAILNTEDNNYESWDSICKVLLDKASRANIEAMKIRPKPRAPRCIATSMHELATKDYKSILLLLSLTESRDIEGWTPLASAAFINNEALCEFLLEKGCKLCFDTEQKEQLKPKLSCRIHDAAKGGYSTTLQLLLDMGADINERHSRGLGETALLEAVFHNQLSCVKILIDRGADATISNGHGRTTLHHAVYTGNDKIMKFLLDNTLETRKLVNVRDYAGETALLDCTYVGDAVRLEMARMLLQAGALLTIKDGQDRTPYERARQWEKKGPAKYLWSQLSPKQQARGIPPPSDW